VRESWREASHAVHVSFTGSSLLLNASCSCAKLSHLHAWVEWQMFCEKYHSLVVSRN